MKNIVIGFSKPKKFKIGAWLIQKWIKRPYSHVYIRYIDNQKRNLVFQAAHGMVHLITYDNFLIDNNSVYEFNMELSIQEYQSFRDFYYSKLAQPYSFLDLLEIPLYDLAIKIGWLNPPSNNFKGYICSSLCAEMLQNVKNIRWIKPVNLVRPDDVEVLFK